MIKAKHHWFLFPFLVWYGIVRIKLHFKKIKISGKLEDRNLPMIIVSNHFSWWDGFIIAMLAKNNFHRKFFIMMEEKQLKDVMFLSQGGVFSIRKNSKSVVETLNYTVDILREKKNMVALFPQGKFESKYQHPLNFEKGLDWILKKLKNEVHLVFLANLVEYFESPKPTLNIYYEEYKYAGKNMQEIEKDYNTFYERSYRQNLT